MTEGHHIVPQQRLKIARSQVAVKAKVHGFDSITEAEKRLLNTPLSRILGDRRNIVQITRTMHHRAHQGFERLRPDQLPAGIEEFAAEYGIEAALDHELRLIGAVD